MNNKPSIRWRDIPANPFAGAPLLPPVYIPRPLTDVEREALAREALAQRMASAISAACWGGIGAILLLLVLA
jgi:hypothetical protein